MIASSHLSSFTGYKLSMTFNAEELVKSLATVTDDSAVGTGLPNLLYVDSDWARFERDNILGRSWTAVTFGSDLPAPGFVKAVELLDIPLLVVRDRVGELQVFHNVCSHRGMKLIHEDTRLRTVIRCPYHSWSYGFDGQLLATPLIGGVDKDACDGFDRANFGLKPVRFAVWMDIVFVNLSGGAEPFDDYIAPLEARWSALLNADNRRRVVPAASGSRIELDVACNWKLAVENYCEAYHLPWVHPSLNSYSPLDKHFNITVCDRMSGQGTNVYKLASTAGTCLPVLYGWPDDQLQYAEYISLYPNTLLGLQADHFFSVIVLPKQQDRCVEKVQISYVDDGAASRRHKSCRDAVLKSWETVFKEDIFAVEGMQAGRNSPGFEGGVLTPVQDIPTRHFHTWVARQYLSVLTST